ncbi:hypothetical protein BHM03_00051528, partial [Ensete ventricosum]
DLTEYGLWNLNVARADPTEQEFGNLKVARADPTEQELGNWEGTRADLIEYELGNLNGAGADPTEQKLRNLNLGFCQGGKHGRKYGDLAKRVKSDVGMTSSDSSSSVRVISPLGSGHTSRCDPEVCSSGASSGPLLPVDARVLRNLEVMMSDHDLDTTVIDGSLAMIRERYNIPAEYGLHVPQPGPVLGFRLDWSAHPIDNAPPYLSEKETVMVSRMKGILSSSRAIKEMVKLWLGEAGLSPASRGQMKGAEELDESMEQFVGSKGVRKGTSPPPAGAGALYASLESLDGPSRQGDGPGKLPYPCLGNSSFPFAGLLTVASFVQSQHFQMTLFDRFHDAGRLITFMDYRVKQLQEELDALKSRGGPEAVAEAEGAHPSCGRSSRRPRGREARSSSGTRPRRRNFRRFGAT